MFSFFFFAAIVFSIVAAAALLLEMAVPHSCDNGSNGVLLEDDFLPFYPSVCVYVCVLVSEASCA
jgi:hypothetical protein